jgi:hypothetical protein
VVSALAKEKPHARITNQFWRGPSMVYDLSCDEVRLTLEVTLRAMPGSPDQWSVHASARQAPDPPTVDEAGATRGEALTAVARAWGAKHGAVGFPPLDWDAVAQALRAVRAI